MDVAIVGIGLHPFGRHDERSGLDLGVKAARNALDDAGLAWSDLEFAYGGSVSPTMTGGATPDTMVGHLGLTGLPFVNIFNGCATGGSALAMACNAIESGARDLGLVVGFDKHPRGAFDPDPAILGLDPWYGAVGLMVTTQFFGMKLTRYMHDHGITERTLARVAAKNYRNGALNPNAWRRKPLAEEEILASPRLNHPLRQYMLCAPNAGGAALVVCRADRAHHYTSQPVFVRAAEVRTRQFGSFEVMSPWLPVDEADPPTVLAATAAYERAGIGPEDIDLVQVQDTDAGSELIHLAESGLCAHGEQERLVEEGQTEIGGRLPVNTDGGLIANGEPVGASGLRQVHEIAAQLRGAAGERQVPGSVRTGYTQVYGTPGVSACTILSV